jgi:hypothetical protein
VEPMSDRSSLPALARSRLSLPPRTPETGDALRLGESAETKSTRPTAFGRVSGTMCCQAVPGLPFQSQRRDRTS